VSDEERNSVALRCGFWEGGKGKKWRSEEITQRVESSHDENVEYSLGAVHPGRKGKGAREDER
jgi:hypothetical protein